VCVDSLFKPRPACAHRESEGVWYRASKYTDQMEMNVCLSQTSERKSELVLK